MTSQTTADPFMLRFAEPRLSQPPMPGRYSASLALWVVDGEDGERPIVGIDGGSLVATQSKTMTQVEVDDDDPSRFGALESATCANSPHPRRGARGPSAMPELQTKTGVEQERDDEAKSPYR